MTGSFIARIPPGCAISYGAPPTDTILKIINMRRRAISPDTPAIRMVSIYVEDAARIYKNEGGHLVKQHGTDSEEDFVYFSLCFSVSLSLFLCVVKVNSISQKRA